MTPQDRAARIALGDALRLDGRKSDAIVAYRSGLALIREIPKS